MGMHGGSYILFWLLTYLLCTIPDTANTLHSLKHTIRPRLLPTITAKSAISNFNREMFALFLHFTIPNTHTDEPQTSYPSSPQHSNFNPSRTLHSRTNYMETTNPTTIATTNPKGLIEAQEEWGYLSINPSFSTIITMICMKAFYGFSCLITMHFVYSSMHCVTCLHLTPHGNIQS